MSQDTQTRSPENLGSSRLFLCLLGLGGFFVFNSIFSLVGTGHSLQQEASGSLGVVFILSAEVYFFEVIHRIWSYTREISKEASPEELIPPGANKRRRSMIRVLGSAIGGLLFLATLATGYGHSSPLILWAFVASLLLQPIYLNMVLSTIREIGDTTSIASESTSPGTFT